MNLYFILHVCRIHNSKLSEENILLLVQNMGNQVTRQLGLSKIVCSQLAGAPPGALTGQH